MASQLEQPAWLSDAVLLQPILQLVQLALLHLQLVQLVLPAF